VEYKVKDLKPAIGENYYRIKIFDSEANYKYTNVRDVLLEDFENQNLVVYPNPATRTITIEPLKPTEKEGIIEVSDANGSLIYQKELEAEFKQFDIDISKYIPGPYFVRIKIDGKRDLIYRIFKIE
ncbi:MAG TPA: T9SS type A sorting domain-containing protein, partial [Saprospiraceae bacterium]|nr:T9SS type A sorting domain-containing protein [Saprospiraceae bacterium]